MVHSFWNFKENDEEIELRINGEIISDNDAWFYEWFGVTASSPNRFRNELIKYVGKDITVWIDSNGGDVLAAAGIYTALREHKGKVTAKVTNAMSAASVIAMAASEIQISPVGMMMIHNPLTGGWGDSRDMRHMAAVLDEVKESIVNAYHQKTNIDRKKIAQLMDNETYMSAKTAVNEGFADKVLYTDEQPVIENNFNFSGIKIRNSIDDSIKRFLEIAQEQEETNTKLENKTKEEKILKLQDLKEKYPELVAEIENSSKELGKKEERDRIKAIEEIANCVSPELVIKAKFEQPMDAQQLAFEAMKNNVQKSGEYKKDALKDIENSGVEEIKPIPDGQVKKLTVDEMVNNAAKRFNRSTKGVK